MECLRSSGSRGDGDVEAEGLELAGEAAGLAFGVLAAGVVVVAAARPRILGALLDLAVEVLAVLPAVRLDELPRMADFARLLGALDQTRRWDTVASYRRAAAEATQAVLESDPVAEAVIAFVGRGAGWRGTAGELLDRITPERRPRGWPQSPRGLSGALARLAPALRAHGVVFERQVRGSDRLLTLRAEDPSQSKPPAQPSRPSRDLP